MVFKKKQITLKIEMMMYWWVIGLTFLVWQYDKKKIEAFWIFWANVSPKKSYLKKYIKNKNER
tara:strand:+ start:1883 stop:2071 length:189 start_codon:yes stop_codon:yes gene_type:complete